MTEETPKREHIVDQHFAQMKALAQTLHDADTFAYERIADRHPIVEQARLRDLRERIRGVDLFVEWYMILTAMEALNDALAPASPPDEESGTTDVASG